jgi:hypothetical protein
MDLPHLNVLTKIDNLANYPPLTFNLDFYTEVQDLEYLLPALDAERSGEAADPDDEPPSPSSEAGESKSKFGALNRAIVELVQDFSLVGFSTLAVEDKQSMAALLKQIDLASGYAFGTKDGAANDSVWQVAMRDTGITMDVRDVQERWIDRKEELDEVERKDWEAEGRGFQGGEVTQPEPDTDRGQDGMDLDLEKDGMSTMGGVMKGMMGRNSGIKVVRKPPPDVKGG